ncbi:hypothetical protein HB770_21015 [Rhizobium leguminosarum bv. viciae]|uniref:Uncharacterized protein n=1 Tax=Rhizobium leguminosarum bv. viciae TaxID=387 RepID=A0A7G6RL53_RHILV|nr:hypothetical protein HB770_21015 [Rhizobium leguminosarum bv. viciae]
MSDTAELHPVQTANRSKPGKISSAVTLKAYEVYRHVYGEQKAIVTGGCRGGFSTGELIAFLYAHTFPKSEWSARADEAFRGAKDL